jgi:amino acid permease
MSNFNWKSKETALVTYISIIILFCFYKLFEVSIVFYKQSQMAGDSFSTHEYEWGYLALFVLVCLIVYEFLMLGWAVLILKENKQDGRKAFTYYLLLFTCSIPLILLVKLYFQTL